MYDPRIGRFFAVDPLTKKYPWYTPYQFSGNRVIDMIELEGLEPHTTHDNLTDAAENFGTEYNGYSIVKGKEIGTQFYRVTYNDERAPTYSYTSPKYGSKSGVNLLQSNDIPSLKDILGAVSIEFVGDAHTHSDDIDFNKDRKIAGAFYWNPVTNKNPSDTDFKSIRDYAKKNMGAYAFFDLNKFTISGGPNVPSIGWGDYPLWQSQFKRLGTNYEGSYVFTPSGLVYSIGMSKDWDSEADTYVPFHVVQRKLTKIVPSDSKSIIRMNNVNADPNKLPKVLPEYDGESIDSKH